MSVERETGDGPGFRNAWNVSSVKFKAKYCRFKNRALQSFNPQGEGAVAKRKEARI